MKREASWFSPVRMRSSKCKCSRLRSRALSRSNAEGSLDDARFATHVTGNVVWHFCGCRPFGKKFLTFFDV